MGAENVDGAVVETLRDFLKASICPVNKVSTVNVQ